MIGHQGPSPGRTPSQADTAQTQPLDGQIEPDTRAADVGTEATVPVESRPESAGNPSLESEHKGVDLARLAWLGTVGACLIAVAILVVQGYYGYAAVTCAVAASAALNLT
jgi:hypothetical protein